MSKLKTVWDAVNELRGDVTNCLHFSLEESSMGMIYVGTIKNTRHTNVLQVTDEVIKNDSWSLVCSIAEFNALVEEMSLGLDVNSVTKYKFSEYLHTPKSPLDIIVNKPLVYTQEMVDNGIKPSIGMSVSTSTGNYEILLPVDLDGMTVVSDNGAYIIQDINGCKPIDTRTKKEKAIDEFMAKNLKYLKLMMNG